MRGFKEFALGRQEVSQEAGLREIRRLALTHYVVARPADRAAAEDYLAGRDGFSNVGGEEVVDPAGLTGREDVVVGMVPKRWFGRLDRPAEAINRVVPFGKDYRLPPNYVWGFCAGGAFYRNAHYHAHDGLIEQWRAAHPAPPGAVDLTRPTPRLFSAHGVPGGRGFHGYSGAFGG